MHIHRTVLRAFIAASILAVPACKSSTDSTATLVVKTDADMTGRVSKVDFESANGPGGPYSQYDIWVIVPPGSSANAGVVLPVSAPVFLRSNGGLTTIAASKIRVGDQIQIWRDPIHVGYGAVQGPPGAPTYMGTQIVVVR